MLEQEETEVQVNKTGNIHAKWKSKYCCLPGGLAVYFTVLSGGDGDSNLTGRKHHHYRMCR